MQKQDGHKPPRAVQAAARRGLELRREHGRGGFSTSQASTFGVGSGVQRATNLANGNNVSLATVRRMKAFFDRHESNNRPSRRESDGGPTAGTIAWLLWGGDPGRRWANSIVEQADRAEKSEDGSELEADFQVCKVDEELGIVFGFAIVCKVNGEDYYDTQGDHITEAAMLDATAGFMKGDRPALDMHQGEPTGQIVFGFPLTEEIAKAVGIETTRTGFLIGMRVDDAEQLEKFRTGERTGFSIGGRRVRETVVED